MPLKTIDQLLIHNTDTAVKPIIGNKEIEKTPAECVYDASLLQFKAWSKEDIESQIE